MVIALFILMVIILLTAEYFSLSKKIESGSHIPSGSFSPVSTESIERYFHRGHSWALVRPSKEVIAGVDDFAQRFIGKVDSIELPQAGSFIRQGEMMATLKHGDRALSPVAPLTGTIVAVNAHLKTEPTAINESPLQKGWIVRISPADLAMELRSLLKGVVADRWQEAVRVHLVHWFSPRVGAVMQDGGSLVDNISDVVNSDEWRLLVDEFFKENSSDIHNNS
jgi:glycine cleavage system H protein